MEKFREEFRGDALGEHQEIAGVPRDVRHAALDGEGVRQGNIGQVDRGFRRVAETVAEFVEDVLPVIFRFNEGNLLIKLHAVPLGGNITLGEVGIDFQIDLCLERRCPLFAALVKDCLFQQADVEVVTDRLDVPVLARAEQVSGTADLHIAEGNTEARAELGVFAEGLQAFSRLLGECLAAAIGQVGIRLP